MVNPILKENVEGQKQPGKYVAGEPELPSFGKPKCEGHNNWKGHKHPNYSRNIMIK